MDPVIIALNNADAQITSPAIGNVQFLDAQKQQFANITKFSQGQLKGNLAYLTLSSGSHDGTYFLTEAPAGALNSGSVIQFQDFWGLPVVTIGGITQLLVRLGDSGPSSDLPAWKQKLRKARDEHKQRIRCEDFSDLFEKVNHPLWLSNALRSKAQLSAASQQGLQQILDSGNVANQASADATKAEIQALKNEPSGNNGSGWKSKLDQSKQRAKEAADANIEKVFNEGEKYIEDNVPAGEQDAAADVFVAGSDLLTAGIGFLVNELLGVIRSIGDFLRGIWNQVKTYASGAINIVTSIGRGIGSLFS